MDPKIVKSWEDFLNPDVIRPRLITASVYIAAFQALKEAIVDHTKTFFWCGFDQSGDKYDPKYETDVLSRNKSRVYASLSWLNEMGAIDANDIGNFDRIKACRNDLSHSLLSMIGGSMPEPPDVIARFHEMFTLLKKIEVWWIRNVEIPSNPDFDGKTIDESEIIPGRVLNLVMLGTIAFGDDAESRQYYEWFRKEGLAEVERRQGGSPPKT